MSEDYTISLTYNDTQMDDTFVVPIKHETALSIEDGFIKFGDKKFDVHELAIMLEYLKKLTKEEMPEEFI